MNGYEAQSIAAITKAKDYAIVEMSIYVGICRGIHILVSCWGEERIVMGNCRCGTETSAPDRFCPSCGAACGAQSKQPAMDCASKESSVKSEVFQQVERAMHGYDSACGDIYENTYRYVYFLAFKFLRSEADVQDITQEVYSGNPFHKPAA